MSRIPGLRRFFRLPSAERDVRGAVDEELRFHLDMLVAENMAAGMRPEDARRAALQRFGDVEHVRDRVRAVANIHQGARRRMSRLADLRQDLAFAARSLRRSPGFTIGVLLTLALGIGATTAIFSVVRGVLLRPLPFPAAEQVVRVWPANASRGTTQATISVTELEDWERDIRGVSAIGAFQTLGDMVFSDGVEPLYVTTTYVSRGFFPALATRAFLGRTLLPAEHERGANQQVVVSHAFWRQQLGGDPRAVGRTIHLDGEPNTVVGVMPPSFDYPSAETAVWVPSTQLGEDDVGAGRQARWMDLVARLRPGVTPEQLCQEVAVLQARLAATYPESNAGYDGATVQGIRESIVGRVRAGLLVLLGAVALVLLIACVNVANLLLVRALARDRELAVRAALGAGRGRIVRLVLTESLVLAGLGGVLGVALGWVGVRSLVGLAGDFLPRAGDVRVDAGVLLFALAVSLLTGMIFGLWPAVSAASSDLSGSMKYNARGSTGGRAAHRARGALVTVEVALAMVLVVGAGLMLRSFERLTRLDVGFRPDHALLVQLQLDGDGPDPTAAVRRLLDQRAQVVERVRQVPGVTEAGATKFAPFTGRGGETLPVTIPGAPAPAPGAEPIVMLMPVSPGYLRALGVPLLEGADVDASVGDSTARLVAVVSQTMAKRFWPDHSPLGELFLINGRVPVRVVGVAADVRHHRLDAPPELAAYVPELAMPRSAMSLVVRTTGDPAELVGPVRAAIREVLPNQPFNEIVPMRAKLSEAASTPRFFTVLVTTFGVLALTLAAVGLYGVVSYVVSQRQREIGVRVALGAPPAGVVALMLRRGMMPVLAGLAIGMVAALAATRLLESLLYDVSATDPLTFVSVALLLGAVGLLASYLPSRRAARVDPTVALRAE